MSDITIAGIGLNSTGGYTFDYAEIPPESLPAECDLPAGIALTTPPAVLTLPPIECQTVFPDPVPIPFTCGVTFINNAIIEKDASVTGNSITVTTDTALSISQSGCCGFSLDGLIKLSVPCIPELTTNITLSVNDENTIEVLSIESQSFSIDNTDPCNHILNGAATIKLAAISGLVTSTTEDYEIQCDLGEETEHPLKLDFTTGTLKLTGVLPKPCFECDGDPVDSDYVFSSINLQTVNAKTFQPLTSTCTSVSARWTDDGRDLLVGKDSSCTVQLTTLSNVAKADLNFGTNSIVSKASTAETSIKLTTSAKTVTIKAADLISASATTVKFREFDICEDGNAKKVMLLASENYT